MKTKVKINVKNNQITKQKNITNESTNWHFNWISIYNLISDQTIDSLRNYSSIIWYNLYLKLILINYFKDISPINYLSLLEPKK